MFLIDVAEWCVEALVISLAFFFAALGALVFMFVCAITWRCFRRTEFGKHILNWWGGLNG